MLSSSGATMVADRKLALQARKLLESDRLTKARSVDADEKIRQRLRIAAVNHVLEEQTVYEPILVRYEEQKIRAGYPSRYVDVEDVL